VVNNNAAAVLLALTTLAKGKEVIVSRGQQVEIGGSFRMPDVMRLSGARMVEVGTTNRTRAADYDEAVTPRTAVLLRVHTSNFRVMGFTESASLAELSAVARRHSLLLVDDLGSGAAEPGGDVVREARRTRRRNRSGRRLVRRRRRIAAGARCRDGPARDHGPSLTAVDRAPARRPARDRAHRKGCVLP